MLTGPIRALLALLLVARIHAPGATADINVFAAASLTDSLKAIAVRYQQQTRERVVFNFAASSTLARQIEAGARADIFFSADEAKMDALERRGLLLPGTRQDRLANSLVIVVAAEGGVTITSPADLANPAIKRIALGDPKAVPIGIYAREYLQQLKLWSSLQPKIVVLENVRSALAAVEAGNAEASIVYRTDAAISRRVKVAFAVSRREGPRITYPLAIIGETRNPEAARRFLAFLNSDDATAVFQQFGFITQP